MIFLRGMKVKNIKICKLQEDDLRTAYRGKYMSAVLYSELDAIISVYEDELGIKWGGSRNCHRCVVDLYSRVGELFFSDKKTVKEDGRV